jgi:hypothetical protein
MTERDRRKGVPSGFEVEDSEQRAFLLAMVEESQGSTSRHVRYYKVGRRLGYSLGKASRLSRQLSQRGYLAGASDQTYFVTEAAIAAYRQGIEAQDAVHGVEKAQQQARSSAAHVPAEGAMRNSASGTGPDGEGMYSAARLAELFDVPKDALRQRLKRYRKRNDDGWEETEGRRMRGPIFRYCLKYVRGIIDDLHASLERPSK